MTAPRPKPPLTVLECATAMSVSKMTVYRLIHDGILPAFQIRGQFRVPQNEFERYLRGAAVIPDWAEPAPHSKPSGASASTKAVARQLLQRVVHAE